VYALAKGVKSVDIKDTYVATQIALQSNPLCLALIDGAGVVDKVAQPYQHADAIASGPCIHGYVVIGGEATAGR
jgi:hypothetical protein